MGLFILYFKSCFFRGYFLFRGSIPIFLEDYDWMETPEERVRHWMSLMSLQPKERHFSHLCESLLFVKAWRIWIYSWLSLNWSACGVHMYPREKLSFGIVWLKGKQWNSTNLHMMNTWFMRSTWIKTSFDFQPRQEIDLHQFYICRILTLFVFCWKVSVLIHHNAALDILTNNAGKCFLNATYTKANVLLSYRRSHNSNCIPESSPAILFVLLLLHYICIKLQKF